MYVILFLPMSSHGSTLRIDSREFTGRNNVTDNTFFKTLLLGNDGVLKVYQPQNQFISINV